MLDKFKRRSYRLEYIDTGDYTPEEYESCISELKLVNRWMGDAHSLRTTLFPEIETQALSSFSVLDVGDEISNRSSAGCEWRRRTRGRTLRDAHKQDPTHDQSR